MDCSGFEKSKATTLVSRKRSRQNEQTTVIKTISNKGNDTAGIGDDDTAGGIDTDNSSSSSSSSSSGGGGGSGGGDDDDDDDDDDGHDDNGRSSISKGTSNSNIGSDKNNKRNGKKVFNAGAEDTDNEEFEEAYVVLDVPKNIASVETLASLGTEAFDLENFASASPCIKIGYQTFVGHYSCLTGSQLVFEKSVEGKQRWNFVASANKRIVLTSSAEQETEGTK